jgi:transposase
MTAQQVLVKQLGALPVIREYLERLQLKETVDALAPVRDVAHLSNGEVALALVANRLTAPQPLYRITDWAETWAVEAVFGIPPAQLNDDRLGRCLDDLAAVHDRLRGDLTVQAIAAFGLETKTVRWDLTSVLVTGAYPPEEQAAAYAQVGYGYASGQRKQVRYLQVTTDDGAVPIWDRPYDGKTADVATVIETMTALREHARCTDFVLIGDSKLLSAANRQALLRARVGYLAPLPRTPELDAAFLAIPPERLVPLDYVSERDKAKPPAERTTYHGYDTRAEVAVADESGRAGTVRVRRLFIRSSEEQAACRRNRQRQRERAEVEIAKVVRQVGSRWCPTVERAQAKIDAILDRRHLRALYQVTTAEDAGRPTVAVTLVPEALARAEALDGYYVLETPPRVEPHTDAATLLAQWKGQWQIEHRHRAAKGPLRVRPLFVLSNRRIVGLITILGIALLVFSLIERAARRALAPTEKVPNLLAGHVAARPTGENVLKALQPISLVTLLVAGQRQQLVAALTPLQHTLLRLIAVPEAAYHCFVHLLPADRFGMCERQG